MERISIRELAEWQSAGRCFELAVDHQRRQSANSGLLGPIQS